MKPKFNMLKCTPKPSPIIFAHHPHHQHDAQQPITVDHDFEQFKKAEREWEIMNQAWMLR